MWAGRRRPLWASGAHLRRSSFLTRNQSTLVVGSEADLPVAKLPKRAEVVICGGGVQGAAIAYELAKRSVADQVVVIDKGHFGGGTTTNSPGLASLLKKSYIETKLSKFSKALFLELEKEHNFYTGWKECGSLYVARTKNRLHEYRRWKSQSVGSGVDCEIVLPDRISQMAPQIRVDDLQGGLYIPGDGVADPVEICRALAHVASQKGVHLVPHCEIKAVRSRRGLIEGLETSQGYIECKHFVNAAGMYARRVGKLSEPSVNVPLHAAEHYFLHTKPIEELMDADLPVVRDPDGHIYCRQKGSSFVAGGFEPVAKPADDRGKESSEARQADWDHFHILLENLLHRLPFLANAKLDHLTNGLEPFSPDGQLILGRAPEIRNYYVAAAMRSVSVTALSGVAHVVCDLILKGRSPFDVHNQDARRFLEMHNNRSFLRDRVKEVPGKVYAISFPFGQYRTGRALRTSPIFTAMSDAGARFNQVMGYERPMYFEPSESSSSSPLNSSEASISSSESFLRSDKRDESSKKGTFYKPDWYSCVEREYIASREKVSLCDFTSFAKFDIWSGGLEVVDMLQKLCSNDVDVPVGTVIHTGMQNELGGYENDVTVARLAENRFFLMAPSIQQTRAYAWMRQHLPQDESIYLQDETSSLTTLCLMGPYAKSTLAKLTSSSLDAFPFFTARYLDVAFAPDILALNVTHTGELGYVLYIPNEFALHVFKAIVEAGREFGIDHCGYFAMRALRIEKFYAFWGHDLDSRSTPIECGRAFRVKLDSGIDFIGRSSLERQMREGIRKMLVMAILDNGEHDSESDPWPWGGEPLFRNGNFVGHTTTTSFGFSLESHVALGYVYHEQEDEKVDVEYVKQGEYEIEIAGRRFPVRIRLNPPVLPLRVGARGDVAANYEPTRHAS